MRKEIILRVNGSSNGRCTPTIRLAQLAREPGPTRPDRTTGMPFSCFLEVDSVRGRTLMHPHVLCWKLDIPDAPES